MDDNEADMLCYLENQETETDRNTTGGVGTEAETGVNMALLRTNTGAPAT